MNSVLGSIIALAAAVVVVYVLVLFIIAKTWGRL